MTHICVSNLTIIGSDNGVSLGRRQAIIWTNAEILSIRSLGIHFSEIVSEIHTFSLRKMHLKISSAKWQKFCLDLSVLINDVHVQRRIYGVIWCERTIETNIMYSRIPKDRALNFPFGNEHTHERARKLSVIRKCMRSLVRCRFFPSS